MFRCSVELLRRADVAVDAEPRVEREDREPFRVHADVGLAVGAAEADRGRLGRHLEGNELVRAGRDADVLPVIDQQFDVQKEGCHLYDVPAIAEALGVKLRRGGERQLDGTALAFP